MSFKNKNIFITGAGGFIGTAAAKWFSVRGAHVVALVKDEGRKLRLTEVADNLTIVRGDILDMDCLRYVLSKYEIDYVLHLAAQPIVRICHNDPYTAYQTNVMGTLNLLEAARTAGKRPEKIIVMTSDKAYGPSEKLPYFEDTPYAVADSYCTSKSCQDMLSLSYARTYGLPVCVVRASNIYGPGDLNTSRLIPRTILRLQEGQSPVLYSGVAGYVREWLYIDDLVRAYALLFDKGVGGEAYNIGGTETATIADIIGMLIDKVDPRIEVQVVQKDFYDIKEQYLNADKLKGLGWKPAVDLSLGLDSAVAWYNGFRKKGGHFGI